ncbi:MAG: vWA domain-containing protein [Planctomycetota bacterium]|jgi:Ca-activated chloride channel family protein
MRFEPASIYFLIALVLLPLIWWRWLQRRPESALRFSSIELLRRQPRRLGVRARHAIPVLRTLAVGLLIVCLARPEKGNELTRIYAEGIAIQMVVDLSGSMEHADFAIGRRRCSRLDAVKVVFRNFVEGAGEDLDGRPDDLVGLIGFARYADSLAPLTLDHDNVLAILDTSETVSGPAVQQHLQEMGRAFERARASGDQRRMRQIQAEHQAVQEENQTAIGDALALAVERLDDLDRRRRAAQQGHRRIKSKVIILLTDGENNAGDLTPAQAAEVARERGVKVYAIGIGAQQRRGAIVDEEQMRRLAESTGGKYFRATGTRSLQQVYAEIDTLEKTETEERRFMQYKLAATNPVVLGGVHLWPLLLIVLILLTVEIVLGNTRLRRIP